MEIKYLMGMYKISYWLMMLMLCSNNVYCKEKDCTKIGCLCREEIK